MKKVFLIAMAVVLLSVTVFNACFTYSTIDCVGCATMLFLGMELLSSTIIAWGFRKLYKQYEDGKLDLFK
jgi:hypothetical protein